MQHEHMPNISTKKMARTLEVKNLQLLLKASAASDLYINLEVVWAAQKQES